MPHADTDATPAWLETSIYSLFLVVHAACIGVAVYAGEPPSEQDAHLLRDGGWASAGAALVVVGLFVGRAYISARKVSTGTNKAGRGVANLPDVFVALTIAALGLLFAAYIDDALATITSTLAPIAVLILVGDHPRTIGVVRFRTLERWFSRHRGINCPTTPLTPASKG